MTEKRDPPAQVQIENQITSLQHKIQKLKDALTETLEACEIENISKIATLLLMT